MSQYSFKNKDKHEVIFGADKPTGGFFFTEFYPDDAVPDDGDDIVITKDSLTLDELVASLLEHEGYELSDMEIKKLIEDWKAGREPTPLQHNISKMFGKDLSEMIKRVNDELSNPY